MKSHVMALRGSCTASLPTSSAVVEFVPAGVGPRDIIEKIESLGYTAELATPDWLNDLSHKKDILKWRTSFLVSLIFGILIIRIVIYFHWIIHTHKHPENQSKVFMPALSVDNMILFCLATPVQFFGGGHFYIQSWKAVSQGTANMDVLVVLATSIAYIYSATILFIAIVLGWNKFPMNFFDVPPVLVVFISLGRWVEFKAKVRVSNSNSIDGWHRFWSNGELLEITQKVKTVVFDKTGTITEGHSRLFKVYAMLLLSSLSLNSVRAIAGPVESNSEHPNGK